MLQEQKKWNTYDSQLNHMLLNNQKFQENISIHHLGGVPQAVLGLSAHILFRIHKHKISKPPDSSDERIKLPNEMQGKQIKFCS